MNITNQSYEILTPISEGGIEELKHIERIIDNGGISFLIIEINSQLALSFLILLNYLIVTKAQKNQKGRPFWGHN